MLIKIFSLFSEIHFSLFKVHAASVVSFYCRSIWNISGFSNWSQYFPYISTWMWLGIFFISFSVVYSIFNIMISSFCSVWWLSEMIKYTMINSWLIWYVFYEIIRWFRSILMQYFIFMNVFLDITEILDFIIFHKCIFRFWTISWVLIPSHTWRYF